MIPIRDNIPARSAPIVNYSIIGACALAFFAQLQQEVDEPSLVERYGMIPARVMHPGRTIEIPEATVVRTGRGIETRETVRPAAEAAVPARLTLLTCIFLHGGWLHFLGNMWFLHIFGDNVEDRFGHLGYLLFYLAGGVAASAAHLASAPSSPIPTIGASGAIAAVMGAYMYLYPHAKVLTVIPIFVFLQMTVLPAPLFLGIWFAIQFFQGAFSITATEATGVAWWAHIGGFVAGLAVAWILGRAHALRPRVEMTLPHTDRISLRPIGRRGGWGGRY
jgi:membrane associated rhomboid family serine protease